MRQRGSFSSCECVRVKAVCVNERVNEGVTKRVNEGVNERVNEGK